MAPNHDGAVGAVGVSGPAVGSVSIGDPGHAFHKVEPVLFTGGWTHADTEIDGGRYGGLDVRAASIRGLSHRQSGTPRQDAYGFAAGGGWFVAAIADGVSSGPLSHEAARLVTRYGPKEVVDRLAEVGGDHHLLDWRGVFERLAQRILHVGARRVARPGDDPADDSETGLAVLRMMATTATFLICDAFTGTGIRNAAVAWLGDSPAWLLRADGSWHCLSAIKGAGSEVASSEVAALPRIPLDAMPSRRFEFGDGDVLLIMSDGVGDPLDDGAGAVGDFLSEAWRVPPAPLDFAAQAAFGRRSYDDDRTVVGVWPRAQQNP